ncbi:hypothetical protein Vadar_026776 [Vaccinium darrowii]|uniref:Uncharacterized protein n=1 Tax=Vaccinium darrowii TaxID=229202 RepID=A0ACB7X4P9_9ERIC|nr:hypothetical protein Vadar_026776 [Vaccinium darrowii]
MRMKTNGQENQKKLRKAWETEHERDRSELSRISLVIELVSMELDEQHAKLLGEARVVPPLLAMASGMDNYNFEVLQKFISIGDGTQLFIDESGIELEVEPIITNLRFQFSSANVLHHFDAIAAMQLNLEVLSWGIKFLKEEALRLLEKHGQGVPKAVRHIESMIRMSEAHAKMHLRQQLTLTWQYVSCLTPSFQHRNLGSRKLCKRALRST